MDNQPVNITDLDTLVVTLRDQVFLFLPRLAIGIVIFLVFWLGNRIIRRIIQRIGKETELPEEVISLLADVIGIAILGFGAITALGTVGIDIGAMIAGLGLTGFALAFALQDIIASTLAGILLLMYRPFSVQDRIKVGSHEGVVTKINLRYTHLHNEGNAILIPNSTLFKEAIIVYDDAENPRPVKLTEPATSSESTAAPDVPEPKLEPPPPDNAETEQEPTRVT